MVLTVNLNIISQKSEQFTFKRYLAMAVGSSGTQTSQPPPKYPAQLAAQAAGSPPTKRDLASWWKTFNKKRKEEEKRKNSLATQFARRLHPLCFGLILCILRATMTSMASSSSFHWILDYYALGANVCHFFQSSMVMN